MWLQNPSTPKHELEIEEDVIEWKLREKTTKKEEDWIHEIRHEWGEIKTKEEFLKQIDFDEKNFEIIAYQCNLRPVVIRNGRNETILVKKYEHFLRTRPIERIELWVVCDDLNLISSINLPKPKPIASAKNLIVVISDEHIGMDTSKSQFWYIYDKEVIMKNSDKIVSSVIQWEYDNLILTFCWDWLDGWSWYTTRWWHKLPQNMWNTEAFKTYVEFKLRIIKWVRECCNNLIVRNVNNSNHWWDFEAIANLAVWQILDWNDINYASYDKFMNHIIVWNRCFIITHGKDQVDMKFWLTLNPNDKVVNFINHYIETCWLRKYKITVLKWDLHQSSYHKTKEFDYHNFPSFAPPSQWVQSNFWDSISWYSTLLFNDEYISRTDYELTYEKNLPENDFIY